eukprot:g10139.t1
MGDGVSLTVAGGDGTVDGGDLYLSGGAKGTGDDGDVILGASNTGMIDVRSDMMFTGATAIAATGDMTFDASGAVTVAGEAASTSLALGHLGINVGVTTDEFNVNDVLKVGASSVSVVGDITLDGTLDRVMSIGDASVANTAGADMTIHAGNANNNDGGSLFLYAGAKDGAYSDGAVVIGATTTAQVVIGDVDDHDSLASLNVYAVDVVLTGDTTANSDFTASAFNTATIDADASVTIGASSDTTTVQGGAATLLLDSDTVTSSTSTSSIVLAPTVLTTTVESVVTEIVGKTLIDHKVPTQVTTLDASGAVALDTTLSVAGVTTLDSGVVFTADASVSGSADSSADITIIGGSGATAVQGGHVLVQGGSGDNSSLYGTVSIGTATTKTVTIGDSAVDVAINGNIVVDEVQVTSTGLTMGASAIEFPVDGGSITVAARDADAGHLTLAGGQSNVNEGGDLILNGGEGNSSNHGSVLLGSSNTAKVVVSTNLEMDGSDPHITPSASSSAIAGVDLTVAAGTKGAGASVDGTLYLDAGGAAGSVIVGSNSSGSLEISGGVATLSLTSTTASPSIISVSSTSTDANLEISAKNEGSGSVTIHGNDASDGVVNLGTVTTKTVNVGSAATGVAITGDSVVLANSDTSISVTSSQVEVTTSIQLNRQTGDTEMLFGVDAASGTTDAGVDLKVYAGQAGTTASGTGGDLYLDAGDYSGTVAKDGIVKIGTEVASSIVLGNTDTTLVDVVSDSVTITTGAATASSLSFGAAAVELHVGSSFVLSGEANSTFDLGEAESASVTILSKASSLQTPTASIDAGTSSASLSVDGTTLIDLGTDSVQIGATAASTAVTVIGSTITAKYDDDNKITVGSGTAGIVATSISLKDTGNTSSVAIVTGTGVTVDSNYGVQVNVAAGKSVLIGTDSNEQFITVGNSVSTSTLSLDAGSSSIDLTDAGVTVTGTSTIESVVLTGNTISGVTDDVTTTSALKVTGGAAATGSNPGGSLSLDGGAGTSGAATGALNLGLASDTIFIGADGVSATTLAGSFTLPGATVTDGTDTLTIAHASLAFTGTTGGTVSSVKSMTVEVTEAGQDLTIDTNAGSVIVGTASTLVQVDSTLEVEGTIT